MQPVLFYRMTLFIWMQELPQADVRISGRYTGILCHKCSIPCADVGEDGDSRLPDRGRTEEFYRGGCRKPGDADDPDVSFTKGFFGTNGIAKREGFTTPDPMRQS